MYSQSFQPHGYKAQDQIPKTNIQSAMGITLPRTRTKRRLWNCKNRSPSTTLKWFQFVYPRHQSDICDIYIASISRAVWFIPPDTQAAFEGARRYARITCNYIFGFIGYAQPQAVHKVRFTRQEAGEAGDRLQSVALGASGRHSAAVYR